MEDRVPTKYGHFEYNIILFGLINAPAIFHNMMNDIFQEFLKKIVVCYLDNTLIFQRLRRIMENIAI
jgi:hypothetical protein